MGCTSELRLTLSEEGSEREKGLWRNMKKKKKHPLYV